jgi:hypothetical protein
MQIIKLSVERIVLTSQKPFDDVLRKIKEFVGHPKMTEFWDGVRSSKSSQELTDIVTPHLSAIGLMEFEEFDDGDFIAIGQEDGAPRSVRLLIGNPLIMKQMTVLVPDAAAYAPATILVDERNEKTQVSYDRMASLLSVYGVAEVSAIAVALDGKIEALIRAAI